MSLRVRAYIYGLAGITLTSMGLEQFEPIQLGEASFTHDVVVERAAPVPALPVTSASMETGTENTGFTWFEKGYVGEWPSAGLPEAGVIFASEHASSHYYRMPSSYRTNNAFLIDAVHPAAVVNFLYPSNYATLSFLTSSGVSQNVIGFNVHHLDGSKQQGSFNSPNWYSGLEPACTGYGCVNAATFVQLDVNAYNPKLYSADVKLANVYNPVTRIELFLSGGTGHTVVFAVSGAPVGAGPFVPVEIEGYTADVVVERDAIKPGFMETNTTATMDNGEMNRAFTWYERGYNPKFPELGLPGAGASVTIPGDGLHRFLMPRTFEGPNAILLDRSCAVAEITLPAPACYSALSFLTASGQGTTTNRCVMFHADGTVETNRIVSPYWLGNAGGGGLTGACVSVSTRLLDQRNVGPPQLYAVDVAVSNRMSAITQLVLSAEAPAANTHAVILALSGLRAAVTPPVRPELTITRAQSNALLIHTSVAGRLESTVSPKIKTSWIAVAAITTNLTVPISTLDKARFYRVVVP